MSETVEASEMADRVKPWTIKAFLRKSETPQSPLRIGKASQLESG